MLFSQLEYFAATMEAGSFYAAAKKIYRTPPAVEKAIHQLEQELGGKLFEPAGRSYRPTSLGKKLYGPTIDVIDGFNRIYDIASMHITESFDSVEYRLAVTLAPRRCTPFGLTTFERFRQEYPEVDLGLLFNSNGTCLDALRSGTADAAVVIGSVDDRDFQSRRLFMVTLKAAVLSTHPLASESRGPLSLREIARYPIARPIDIGSSYRAIKTAFDSSGASPHFVDVPIGTERAFLERGGVVLVSDQESINPVGEDVTIKSIIQREQIILPANFVRWADDSNKLSKRLESYLALAGVEIKKTRLL